MIATLPSTPRGTALVSPGHGVKINYIYYWADVMDDPSIQRQQVPVRFDPFDLGTAYAFIGRRWVECHSDHYRIFQGRSQKELLIASKQLRGQNRERGRQYQITASKLAQALQSATLQESLLLQRLRARKSQQTRERTRQPDSSSLEIPQPAGETPVTDPIVMDEQVFESF
jgi:putative transposase